MPSAWSLQQHKLQSTQRPTARSSRMLPSRGRLVSHTETAPRTVLLDPQSLWRLVLQLLMRKNSTKQGATFRWLWKPDRYDEPRIEDLQRAGHSQLVEGLVLRMQLGSSLESATGRLRGLFVGQRWSFLGKEE